MTETGVPVRLDKWLWAARFYKTRPLAVEAIEAGHVQLNDARAKRSRGVKPGDRLLIRKGPYEFAIVVLGVSERRGPASEAQKLYMETEESSARRAELAEQERFAALSAPSPERRPDKRERRRILRFVDKGH